MDLESQLEAARGRLNRAAENLVHWSDAAEEVRTAVARRSSVEGDLLAPAKQALAEERVERMLAAAAARPAGRPKAEVSRSRGAVAHRSEHCVWCTEQNVSDEDSYLLHSDPELAVPVTTPEQAAAERSGYSYAREISR